MKRFAFLLSIAALAACQSGPVEPVQGGTEALILERAASISPVRMEAAVAALSGIRSRFMHYDEGCTEALELLMDWLESQGNEARLDSFAFFRNGRWVRSANIVVDFPGTVAPERQVLVGAHWDSSAGNASAYDSSAIAPGAVDNATGVAALLELARLLKDTPTAYTVRVILFGGEELGFKGSRPVAEWWRHEEGPDSLVCMVNVDMIGWDGDGARDISLLCHGVTCPLAAEALPLAAELAAPVAFDTLNWPNPYNSPGSDHYWFWLYELPAVFITEGPRDEFPFANSTRDSLGAVMPDMLEAGAKAVAATVLRIAQVQAPAS